MPRKVKPVPTGYRTVTPYLVVRNAIEAIAFYEAAFGATVVSKHMDEAGYAVVHAEIKIGNAIVLICDEVPAHGILSPSTLGGTPVAMHLYLADLGTAWDRASAAGAQILVPMHDTVVGERFGKIVDPFGHVWTLAQRIALPSNESRPPKELLHAVPAQVQDTLSETVLHVADTSEQSVQDAA